MGEPDWICQVTSPYSSLLGEERGTICLSLTSSTRNKLCLLPVLLFTQIGVEFRWWKSKWAMFPLYTLVFFLIEMCLREAETALFIWNNCSNKACGYTNGSESNYDTFISPNPWPSWTYYVHKVNLSRLCVGLSQARMLARKLTSFLLCGFAIQKM